MFYNFYIMNRKILDKTFKQHNLDVIISMAPQTRLWYAKVQTSDGFLFIEPNAAHLHVDGRYIEYVQENAQNVEVHLFKSGSLSQWVKTKTYKTIGIEKDYLTLAEFGVLKTLFPDANFVEISGMELRSVKSEEEIKLIEKAAEIALKALEELKPEIKPGITELELDNKLIYLMKKHGAEKNSFDSIIASGTRGSLPHGRASDKKLEEGELVTFDFGAIYKGYCSDITRTFHVGKVTDKKLLEIEQVLREAQALGKEAVKPGVLSGDIDKVCRDYITEKGYGEYFTHGTGHGLGIDVHELPYVSQSRSIELEPGMIITVEPGIYIPGLGGIRVEDDVLVTEKGHKVLSK